MQEIAEAVKGVDIPVLVKNPINAELGLWIGAIERLHAVGVRKLAAIHRGFSTYVEMEFRNDPKWQIPIELKRLWPDLPLICDPSHISGQRHLIEPVSQMALDIGIQGLMIETHIDPDRALSDAKQQVTPEALCRMLERLRVRDAPITDRDVKQKISRLRAEISHIDAKIIQDLAERMKWVDEIGRLKQQHGIPVLQLERWENLLGSHLAKGKAIGPGRGLHQGPLRAHPRPSRQAAIVGWGKPTLLVVWQDHRLSSDPRNADWVPKRETQRLGTLYDAKRKLPIQSAICATSSLRAGGQLAVSNAIAAFQSSANRPTAVCSRLLTVPTGIPSIPAISA